MARVKQVWGTAGKKAAVSQEVGVVIAFYNCCVTLGKQCFSLTLQPALSACSPSLINGGAAAYSQSKLILLSFSPRQVLTLYLKRGGQQNILGN